MRHLCCASLFSFIAISAFAQSPDPSGHWRGALQIPDNQLAVEIDLERTADGTIRGAITIPSERLTGLPLLSVAQQGKAMTFAARKDQPVTGTMSDDGRWIVGEMAVQSYRIPITLERTGAATLPAPLVSAPISAALAGAWQGTVTGGAAGRVALRLENHANGTSSGRLVNLDQGELEIPVKITPDGTRIALAATAVAITFTGTLDPAAGEITGYIAEGAKTLPVTFRK